MPQNIIVKPAERIQTFTIRLRFEQFGHYIDPSTRMNNIPVIADVLKDNYSKMDYNWNRCFFTKEELIGTILQCLKILVKLLLPILPVIRS